MPQTNGGTPATPDDVLAVMSQLLYTDKPADQLKAADMLAKHHGLLTPREESGFDPELIAEIEEAVKQIAAEYHEPEMPSSPGAADEPTGPDGPLVRPRPADG